MLRGTDISEYQTTTVPAGDFVIIKATEGLTYVNAKLKAQTADARRRGLLIGFYHFGHPAHDPVAEAEHFYAAIRGLLRDGDIICLDHEDSDGTSPAHCSAWAQSFTAHTALRTQLVPVVYTYLEFAREGRCAGLGRYPLWIADPSRPAGQPRVPAPWSDWLLHQYTGTGLDRDVLNGDRSAWPGGAKPLEEDMPFAGQIPAGKGEQVNVSFPRGSLKAVGLVVDNSLAIDGVIAAEPQAEVRYAIHRADGSWQTGTTKVGSADGGKDHSPKKVISFTSADKVDYVSFVRLDDGKRTVGWDMS